MKTRLVALAATVLMLVVVMLFRRNSGERSPEPTNRDAAARALQRARVLAAASNLHNLHSITNKSLITTPVSRRACEEWNRFARLVQPFGMDRLEEEEVTYVNMDRDRLLLETKTHLAEFFTRNRSAPKLRHFLASQDMSNPVTKPEGKEDARKTWYKATAKWTEQEALAETHRIMEKLGIRFEIGATKVTPLTIDVPTPTGERVTVTPFWTVDLMDTAGSLRIIAEFRMGESGPGRLTEWFDHAPPDANPRTAPANPNPQ